jgi:hypothetical protein
MQIFQSDNDEFIFGKMLLFGELFEDVSAEERLLVV